MYLWKAALSSFLFLLLALTGCSSPPEWTEQTSFSRVGRKFYVGTAKVTSTKKQTLGQAQKEAKDRAESDARARAARELTSHVQSIFESETDTRQVGVKSESRRVSRSYVKLEGQAILRGGKIHDTYIDEENQILQVLVSFPQQELEPTRLNLQRQAERIALDHFRNDRWKKAARTWEVVFLVGDVPEPTYAQLLSKSIICYERIKDYSTALRQVERFLNRYPRSSKRDFFEKEKKRLAEELKKANDNLTWDNGVVQLRLLFERYQDKTEFFAQSSRSQYTMGEKIQLDLYSRLTRNWHAFWIDDTGVYLYDNFSRIGGLPEIKGQMVYEMGTSSEPGDVILLTMALDKSLTFPVDEVSKVKLERGDSQEKQRFLQILQYLKEQLAKGQIYTDVTRFEFEVK